MDLKRYVDITGSEALERLGKGLYVFSEYGNRYYIEGNNIYMESNDIAGTINLNIAELLKKAWYVKKPFDVRKEMLERPETWVGAFKDEMGYWHKVGFSTGRMQAKETAILSKESTPLDYHEPCSPFELDCCIPIEDVPKEVLQ